MSLSPTRVLIAVILFNKMMEDLKFPTRSLTLSELAVRAQHSGGLLHPPASPRSLPSPPRTEMFINSLSSNVVSVYFMAVLATVLEKQGRG